MFNLFLRTVLEITENGSLAENGSLVYGFWNGSLARLEFDGLLIVFSFMVFRFRLFDLLKLLRMGDEGSSLD